MAKISINLKEGEIKKDENIVVGIDLGTTNSLVAYVKDETAVAIKDSNGKNISIKLISGNYNEIIAPKATPNSWAADTADDDCIWIRKLEAGASWEIPKTVSDINRSLYFYQGEEMLTEGYQIPPEHAIDLISDTNITIQNGNQEGHFLFLQGKPIGEPVAKQGPFVMNTHQEINKAIAEYHSTQFGGWPWPKHDHTHDINSGRFALFADGKKKLKNKISKNITTQILNHTLWYQY